MLKLFQLGKTRDDKNHGKTRNDESHGKNNNKKSIKQRIEEYKFLSYFSSKIKDG